MPEALSFSTTNPAPLQRSKSLTVTPPATNQRVAQAVLNFTSIAANTANATQLNSKPLGFSTNLPRGSIVDRLV